MTARDPAALRDAVDVTMEDGAVIRLRRHGNSAGPRLMLSHGNGLAIDGYLPFWRGFCGGYDLVVFDFRNHGQNSVQSIENHRLPIFARDMERLKAAAVRRWGEKRTAGVFHSMSAITATLHSVDLGGHWDALVLFDPPLLPPPDHPLFEPAMESEYRMARWAAQRPDRFASPEELAARFRATRSLSRWVEPTYDLMARAILRQDGENGGWALACPRAFEAQIYEANAGLGIWPRLAGLGASVKLICSDPDAPDAQPQGQVCRDAARAFDLAYEAIPDTSHLLQIERPDACMRAATAFLDRHGLLAAAEARQDLLY